MKLYHFHYQTFGTWKEFHCEADYEAEAWDRFYAHVGYDPEEIEMYEGEDE